MTLPKISIITVVYNGAKTLKETIVSVLEQTYDCLELIIVDGGSTDGTLNILKKYDAPKIVWKSEPDKGIYDAMNKGIKMATGDFIYFLGADDTFYNNDVLENIFSNTENKYYDLLYGNVYAHALKRTYDGEFSKDKLLFQNISHQAIFYRKDVHQKVGYYKDQYKTFADWNMNIECFFHPGIRVKYIDIVIANFAAGGLGTSQPDLPFLRNYLFPKNLWSLNNKGIQSLKSIGQYDKWWRLLRSLRLHKEENDLSHLSKEEPVPFVIQRMFNFQQILPADLIWNGVFSKTTMFISYCISRVSKSSAMEE